MSKKLAYLAVIAALLVAVPAAQADHIPSNLGIEVTAVDPVGRTVTGIQHCTSPDRAGSVATFPVTSDIDFAQFHPGQLTGVAVDPNGVILSSGPMPCDVRPQGPPPGPGGPPPGPGVPPGPGGPDGPHGHDGPGGTSNFARGFLTRVWKFRVELDSAEGGKVDVTISKVINLPKRMNAQDDELVDQAAVVLVEKKARVYEDGKRVSAGKLDDADGNAVVHGKLLPPHKWQKDEDGEPVPTIRARKIYL